jgi:hypothetical protein
MTGELLLSTEEAWDRGGRGRGIWMVFWSKKMSPERRV